MRSSKSSLSVAPSHRRRLFRRVAYFAIGIGLLAAGCQPLPRPFKPDDARKAANPLLRLPDSTGIVVRPVAGMPGDEPARLAREMADALIRRDVPAFTDDGNRGSYVLTGEAIAIPKNVLRTEIRLIWKLADAKGVQIGRRVVDVATRKSAWAHGSPGLLREIATQSAGPVADIVQGPALVDRVGSMPAFALFVLPIKGAPKAAGELLRAELESALERQNYRVAMTQGGNSLAVAGTVSMAPAPPDKRRMSLEWKVTGADGRTLGTLRQANTVTRDQLEDDWPQIARAIAGGAAEGVRDMLEKTRASAVDAGTNGARN